MRGKDSNRNYLRDIQMLFFMTRGDLFLDYLPISNQKIKLAQAKENGEIVQEQEIPVDENEPEEFKTNN